MWANTTVYRQRANFIIYKELSINQQGKDKQPNRYMSKVQEQADSREKQAFGQGMKKCYSHPPLEK